jgi:predicted ATPase/DNA-binding XRE family transcriptional regulator
MSETTQAFGDLPRRLRSTAGLSQEDLAERSGVSRNGISDLERGLSHSPRFETVRLLADGLGLDADERATLLAAARPAMWPDVLPEPATRPRNSLPAPLTRLIGRETDVMTLQGRLQDDAVRLLTLTGPGGVGKTRLALAVTEQPGNAFPDGRVFVDLAPLRDPSLLLPHVAATLRLREPAGRILSDVIHDYLCERDVLLVLDNFEHVLPAAPVVADLLAAGPRVKVLVTSRAPLRLRVEREYPVPPLRLPGNEDARNITALAANEAVAFFVDRARAVQPDFALTSDNAAAVIKICHRLDGLPLAIELAATRVRMLAPQAMLTRLDQRLPFLTGGARDAPHRQRTLRNTMAWSYDLLKPEEQALFRRLAVFSGGASFEAVEAVANPDDDLDVFGDLE